MTGPYKRTQKMVLGRLESPFLSFIKSVSTLLLSSYTKVNTIQSCNFTEMSLLKVHFLFALPANLYLKNV